MTHRYEIGHALDTPIALVDPDDPNWSIWDLDQPGPQELALVIGNPWACAYAVLGDITDLERFVAELAALLRTVQPPARAAADVAIRPERRRGILRLLTLPTLRRRHRSRPSSDSSCPRLGEGADGDRTSPRCFQCRAGTPR
jgi:hypothetical protein